VPGEEGDRDQGPEDPEALEREAEEALGLSIDDVLRAPLVDPEDVRTQAEVDRLVLTAWLDQVQREYASAKLLVHLVRDRMPDSPSLAYFEAKVKSTRRSAEVVDQLLKMGLSDPTL
jgi:hypothetical protein